MLFYLDVFLKENVRHKFMIQTYVEIDVMFYALINSNKKKKHF